MFGATNETKMESGRNYDCNKKNRYFRQDKIRIFHPPLFSIISFF